MVPDQNTTLMVWKTPMKSRKCTNVGRNRWYVHWTEYSQIYSVVGLFNSIPVAWYISRRNVQTGWNNTVHVWTLHTVMFSLVCAQNEGDFVCPTHGTAVPCVHWIKTTWKTWVACRFFWLSSWEWWSFWEWKCTWYNQYNHLTQQSCHKHKMWYIAHLKVDQFLFIKMYFCACIPSSFKLRGKVYKKTVSNKIRWEYMYTRSCYLVLDLL